jgi:hypothetical protein
MHRKECIDGRNGVYDRKRRYGLEFIDAEVTAHGRDCGGLTASGSQLINVTGKYFCLLFGSTRFQILYHFPKISMGNSQLKLDASCRERPYDRIIVDVGGRWTNATY